MPTNFSLKNLSLKDNSSQNRHKNWWVIQISDRLTGILWVIHWFFSQETSDSIELLIFSGWSVGNRRRKFLWMIFVGQNYLFYSAYNLLTIVRLSMHVGSIHVLFITTNLHSSTNGLCFFLILIKVLPFLFPPFWWLCMQRDSRNLDKDWITWCWF